MVQATRSTLTAPRVDTAPAATCARSGSSRRAGTPARLACSAVGLTSLLVPGWRDQRAAVTARARATRAATSADDSPADDCTAEAPGSAVITGTVAWMS